jgi:hypothetical protein
MDETAKSRKKRSSSLSPFIFNFGTMGKRAGGQNFQKFQIVTWKSMIFMIPDFPRIDGEIERKSNQDFLSIVLRYVDLLLPQQV